MRWRYLVVIGCFATTACSLLVSLDGLDNGSPSTGGSQHDASVSDANPGRPDARDSGVGQMDAPKIAVDAPMSSSDHAAPPPIDSGDAGLPPYVLAVLADNPYAYWRFEEANGGRRAQDQMGTVHTGDLVGGVTAGVPGLVGRGMMFDGSTGCITIESGTDFAFPSPQAFTLELWIKPSSVSSFAWVASTEATQGRRFGWSLVLSSADAGGPYLDLEGWNADKVDGGFIFGAYSSNTPVDGKVPPNVWTYVVGIYSGGTTSNIYVNGIARNMGTEVGGLGDAGSFAIGCLFADAPVSPFEGVIDEVAVYKTGLTNQQISAHYAASGQQ